MGPTRNKVLNVFKYALLFGSSVIILLIFIPRTYQVPQQQPSANTQYWSLATGSKIAYTLVAAKNKKHPYPIIFLQGGPGGFISSQHIETLSPLSEDGFDLYLYDQIGSGRSDRLADIKAYTATRHKEDLEEIIKQIGASKVILIGQSWGAILATLLIADKPEWVECAIFTGAGPIQPMSKAAHQKQSPDHLNLRQPPYSNKMANRHSKSMRMRAVAFWAKSFGKKLASDKEVDDFQTYLNSALNKATVCDTAKAWQAAGGGGYYAQVMTVQSFDALDDPRPKLKAFKGPVYIMRGQCDNQPWGVVLDYMACFSNHEVSIIPDAGHSISVEQPELYLESIRAFLNR